MIEIDARTARDWFEKGEALIVDVREDGEYAARHVPGSLHMPLGRLSGAALGDAKERKVVLVCASGMRSARGCASLRPQGFEAYSLKGGIGAWAGAGGAVEASPGAAEAAAAQAKLMAAALVILGLGLAATVHMGFLVLAGIAGGRLVSLLRSPAAPSCSSGAPGQTACSTPDAQGKTGGCAGCGARNAR